jgi:hypothetical protein
MKPTFKAPGANLLTLKCDEPLLTFAFKFNLRRYTMDPATGATHTLLSLADGGALYTSEAVAGYAPGDHGVARKAGAYTRPLLSST